MIKSVMSGSWQTSKPESDQVWSYSYQFTKNTEEGKGWTKTFLLLHGKLILGGGSDGKNLPVMQETQVWSLGREDSLEKGMATHSCIPACRIPRTEEPGGLWSMGLQRVGHDLATKPPSPWKSSLASFWLSLFFLLIDKTTNAHFQGLWFRTVPRWAQRCRAPCLVTVDSQVGTCRKVLWL